MQEIDTLQNALEGQLDGTGDAPKQGAGDKAETARLTEVGIPIFTR